MKARWLGFVSIALLALVSCSTVDPVTGKRVQNMYLIQDDVQMGREVMADTVAAMRKEGVRINKDAEQVAKLQTIVRR
ncbi:MAG: hypothetical protein J5I99_06915, partial [Verrucomicrobia bacterium]|nr:hypothetical protein [Verrucomicrobiota bacterium]